MQCVIFDIYLLGRVFYEIGFKRLGILVCAICPYADSVDLYKMCPYSRGDKCRIWNCAAHGKGALLPCKAENTNESVLTK